MFKCLPWQFEEQLERDPDMVFAIMEMRGFVNTHHAIKNAKTEGDVPPGPMADLWADIEIELMQERRERD
jgi:hypothetical protein